MIKFESNFNQENTSGYVANKRLKYIITQDRFKFSPELLAEIKNDIININDNNIIIILGEILYFFILISIKIIFYN